MNSKIKKINKSQPFDYVYVYLENAASSIHKRVNNTQLLWNVNRLYNDHVQNNFVSNNL